MYTRFFSCMFKSWELDLICIWFQPITIPDVTFSFLANHIARLHLNLRCYPITNARDFVKSLALIHYKCFWGFFNIVFANLTSILICMSVYDIKCNIGHLFLLKYFLNSEKSLCVYVHEKTKQFSIKHYILCFFFVLFLVFFSHNHYRLIKSEPQLLFKE